MVKNFKTDNQKIMEASYKVSYQNSLGTTELKELHTLPERLILADLKLALQFSKWSNFYQIYGKTLTTDSHPQVKGCLTVNELQQLTFSHLSLQEKIAVKKRGRPTPDVLIFQPGVSKDKKYIRSFNSEWYQRRNWLCGCEVKNALFCFPCLLYGGDATWTKDGFQSLTRLSEKTEKHEKSVEHLENVVSLSFLEAIRVEENPSEVCRLSINKHNIYVSKNREILSKLIDLVFFSGSFETPFLKHDVKDSLVNPGIFRELVNFSSKFDTNLKNCLESSSVFENFSMTIQNEILDCLLHVYYEEIKTEIRKASFVAVIADDTTYLLEHPRIVLVVRYVLNGEIFERFWGFFYPENQNVECLSECILEQLSLILQGSEQKLVAQTFDGASFMKDKTEVQTKIKAVYKNAHFIHSYAHHFDLVVRNAASITQNTRIFFSNILAIPTFFSRSLQCLSILNKHMEVSRLSSTRFALIREVYENLQPLKNCLAEIQSTSSEIQTIVEATGIFRYLNDDNTKFWLEFFYQIVPLIERIYIRMQSPEINLSKVREYVANFQSAVIKLRNSKYCENPSKILMAEAKELCDSISADITERYFFTTHLVAANLLNRKSFTSFQNKHPKAEIELTAEAYPAIDRGKLETELKVFYCRPELHGHSKLIELLKFIMGNNLDNVFSEIAKVIKILLTIPMVTSETERCFSTVEKIKTFLKGSASSERLNALAVLSVEKNFFSSHSRIKEKIIDLFAQIDTRRMDFIYK